MQVFTICCFAISCSLLFYYLLFCCFTKKTTCMEMEKGHIYIYTYIYMYVYILYMYSYINRIIARTKSFQLLIHFRSVYYKPYLLRVSYLIAIVYSYTSYSPSVMICGDCKLRVLKLSSGAPPKSRTN